MSWELDYDEEKSIVCPCGRGKIKKRVYSKSDDWNRSESGEYGEELICENCSILYHIERIDTYVNAPPWKWSGHIISYFLVPNGMTLKSKKRVTNFNLNFKENVVAHYTVDEIKLIIEDMQKNKFSTRLENPDSSIIVNWHKSKYKKNRLIDIILKLQECIDEYAQYEWPKEKYSAFKEQEILEIEKEQERIERVKKLSIKLDF